MKVNWTIRDILPTDPAPPLVPDRGGYTLTMRESDGIEEALACLATNGAGERQGRVHMGWGSFRNLDIAAARRSAWVLLLDVNLHQFRVWDAVRAALRAPGSIDASAFVEAVVPLLPHEPRLRQFSPSTRTWLLGDLERPGSWLCQERPERFAWVRGLFLEDRVATDCMDLRGMSAGASDPFGQMSTRMKAAVRRARIEFDTLYVSNIPWMLAQHEGFFGESHTAFLNPGAENVLDQVHGNLRVIAPLFRHVVSASHLSAEATPDNLQWRTEVLPPARFLDDAYWSALSPVDTPYRQI